MCVFVEGSWERRGGEKVEKGKWRKGVREGGEVRRREELGSERRMSEGRGEVGGALVVGWKEDGGREVEGGKGQYVERRNPREKMATSVQLP